MKIKELDDKYILNSDSFCYWITCKYTNKKGKVVERRVSGYYATLEQVVENFIDRKMRSSEATEISQLKDEIAKLKETVKGWNLNEQINRC